MRIVQEGKNLSLMEVDILRSTGCKWSKILYPGFKGYIKPQDKTDKFNSAEKYSNIQPLSRDVQNLNQFMHSFNQEYNKIVDSVGAGLRNSCSSTSNEKSIMKKQSLPFSNECIISSTKSFAPSENTSNVKTLQQRILEGNFHEPKSLFAKGPVQGATGSNLNRRTLGLPYEYMHSDGKQKIQEQKLYNLNLETVQEKVNEKQVVSFKNDFDNADREKPGKKGNRQGSMSHNSVTKKIINGNVILSGHPNIKDLNESADYKVRQNVAPQKNFDHFYRGQKSDQSQKRCFSGSKMNPQILETKSSFTNVAQQIIKSQDCQKQSSSNCYQLPDYDQQCQPFDLGKAQRAAIIDANSLNEDLLTNGVPKYCDLASVAPS